MPSSSMPRGKSLTRTLSLAIGVAVLFTVLSISAVSMFSGWRMLQASYQDDTAVRTSLLADKLGGALRFRQVDDLSALAEEFAVFGAGVENDTLGLEVKNEIVVGGLALGVHVQGHGVDRFAGHVLGVPGDLNVADGSFPPADGEDRVTRIAQTLNGHVGVALRFQRGAQNEGCFGGFHGGSIFLGKT